MSRFFVVLAMLAAVCPGARAQWSFNLVANTSTSVPGGVEHFSGFGGPFIAGARVAFSGGSPNTSGVYSDLTGTLAAIVNQSTVVPGTAGHFLGGGSPMAFDGLNATFSGGTLIGGQSFGGVYSGSGGPLSTIVDNNTQLPQNSGAFAFPSVSAAFCSRRGSNAAFLAGQPGVPSSPAASLYGWTSGTYHRLLDVNTPMPGGTGNFRDLYYVSLSGTAAVLTARDTASKPGVFIVPVFGGPIETVVDPMTPIPNGSGTFTGISAPGIDGGNITFAGAGTGGQTGVYARIDGQLVRIADEHTAAPEGGNFLDLSPAVPSISGHNVVFEAINDQGDHGIYVWRDGIITRVIHQGETVGGIFVGNFAISTEAIDGDTIAFAFSNGPGQGAVYTATYIPGPSTLVLGAAAGLIGLRRRRRPSCLERLGLPDRRAQFEIKATAVSAQNLSGFPGIDPVLGHV